MLFADVVEGAIHAALEDTEEVFDVVCGEAALVHVPAMLVKHALMLRKFAADLAVDQRFIGNQRALAARVLS